MAYNYETVAEKLYYKNEPIVEYKVVYPVITGTENGISKINEELKADAELYVKKIKDSFYPKAAVAFDSKNNGEDNFSGFYISYNAVVTSEENGKLSVLVKYDEDTGDEGSRIYYKAFNRNMSNGTKFLISDYFKSKEDVINLVTEQIEREIREGNESYLPDWRERASRLFKSQSFYLKENKLIVFYDQYDLISYSFGVKEFEIANK